MVYLAYSRLLFCFDFLMSLERERIVVTSADRFPRSAAIEVAGVRIPVRDAVASLIFAGLIGVSISMIPKADVLPEAPHVEKPDPNSLEMLRKTCLGTIVSKGRGVFSCEPSQKLREKLKRPLENPINIIDPFLQIEKKTNSRKEEV